MNEYIAHTPSQAELNAIYARAHRMRREAMASMFRAAIAYFKGFFAHGAVNPAR